MDQTGTNQSMAVNGAIHKNNVPAIEPQSNRQNRFQLNNRNPLVFFGRELVSLFGIMQPIQDLFQIAIWNYNIIIQVAQVKCINIKRMTVNHPNGLSISLKSLIRS